MHRFESKENNCQDHEHHTMRGTSLRRISLLCAAVLCGGLLAPAQPAAAQEPGTTTLVGKDVPPGHWAYSAVNDLAKRGLILGYPPTGDFLGGRTVTRYELAVIVKRILDYLAQQNHTVVLPPSAPPSGNTASPPPQPTFTNSDIQSLRRLVEALQPELVVIGADVRALKEQVKSLRANVDSLQAKEKRDNRLIDESYGVPGYVTGDNRRFWLGGFMQMRYLFGPHSGHRFPEGAEARSAPYNGNYAQGGDLPSFVLRRARLEMGGRVTDNTRYALFAEFAGAVNGTSGSNAFSGIRQAAISYTTNDGDQRHHPTLTAGAIAVPFGYFLSQPPPISLVDERPLIANETSNGLFPSQDWDKGARIDIPLGPLTATAALLNGTGYAANNTHRNLDKVYRLAAQGSSGLGGGISYYDGQITGSNIGSGDPFAEPGLPDPSPGYALRRRRLFGADLRWTPAQGLFAMAEYAEGRYDQLSAFGLTTTSLANVQGYGTIASPGNKVRGYTVQGGWRTPLRNGQPLTVYAAWDVLQRSISGRPDSGSAYDDKNLTLGVQYNLDKVTQIRFYNIRPQHVAFAPTPAAPTAARELIQLSTIELRLRF